ncbi:hypothetical protein, partial [Candidatus Cardinium sp. cBcalN2]
MLKFNFKKYFFLILLGCIVHGCGDYTQHQSLYANENTNGNKNHASTSSIARPEPEGLFVMLHGHNMDNDTDYNHELAVVEKVRKILKDKETLVNSFMPTCREGKKSDDLSIDDQASLVINETKEKLTKDFQNKFPQWSPEEIAR